MNYICKPCNSWMTFKVTFYKWLWPRPFQGWLIVSRLGLAMVNLSTNMKSLSTPATKIWKAVQNKENGVVWGGYGSLRLSATSTFDRMHKTSYPTFMQTMRLCCTIFEIVCYLFKVADFNPPHMQQLEPLLGVTSVKFCWDLYLWHQKTRVPALLCGVVCVIIRLAILEEPLWDRRMDRQTDTGP